MQFLLASTETATEAANQTSNANLFEALGIDWQLLIVQGAAFLVLVFLLGKFVYPVLIRSIDKRRSGIEAAMQEAKDAQEALNKAEARAAALLATARTEADEIIARSHQETTAMIAEAETKAKTRADQIIKSARAQLDADVAKARAQLKKDTVELVALATEKIIQEKLDERKDAALVREALQEKA